MINLLGMFMCMLGSRLQKYWFRADRCCVDGDRCGVDGDGCGVDGAEVIKVILSVVSG